MYKKYSRLPENHRQQLYDLVWVCSMNWLLVYCGSSTYNDINCLVGFFFCTSHLLVPLFVYLTLWRMSEDQNLEATPTSITEIYKQSESPTHLQKVLEMCIGIFIWLARERICLHHVDQCWLEFKVSVSHHCRWSGRDIGVGGGRKTRGSSSQPLLLTRCCLLDRWCSSLGSRETSEGWWHRVALSSQVTSDCH
jgi:hypothetical protein